MKTVLFVFGICLLTTGVSLAQVTGNPEFREVPHGDWSLSAINQLTNWGYCPSIYRHGNALETVTRYDVAAETVRSLDKFGYLSQKENAGSKDILTVRDVLAALIFEYRDEIAGILMSVRLQPTQIDLDYAERHSNYLAYKESHKTQDSSAWYESFKERPWERVKFEHTLPPRKSN